MIQHAPQTQPMNHLTPSQLTESQDQLLSAGSKLSFTDIYNKEMSIPLVKGKFYRAEDVDDTFILINGVLADIGQQTFSKSKQLVALQEEVSQLKSYEQQVEDMQSQIDSLQAQLEKRENDLRQFVLATKDTVDGQASHIQELESENDAMGEMIERLVQRLGEVTETSNNLA
jgi:hypothetical protein